MLSTSSGKKTPPAPARVKSIVRKRPSAIDTEASQCSVGCVMMPSNRRHAIPASSVQADTVRTPRQRQLARINQALKDNDGAELLSLFKELGVDMDDSPVYQTSKKRPHSDISQMAPNILPNERGVITSSVPSFFGALKRLDPRVARELIHTYFADMHQERHRVSFVQTIEKLNADILKTLFLPFRTQNGQASFYQLIRYNHFHLIFKHLPVDVLGEFVDMLISPRRVTSTEGVLFNVIDQLKARRTHRPEEKTAVDRMLEKLVDAGLSFHRGQNNHLVVMRLEYFARRFLPAREAVTSSSSADTGPSI